MRTKVGGTGDSVAKKNGSKSVDGGIVAKNNGTTCDGGAKTENRSAIGRARRGEGGSRCHIAESGGGGREGDGEKQRKETGNGTDQATVRAKKSGRHSQKIDEDGASMMIGICE